MPNHSGQARSGPSGGRNPAPTPRNRNPPPLQPRPSSHGGSSLQQTANGAARHSKLMRTGFGTATPPTGQRDRGSSLRELSHERQAAIDTASEQLASWDQLVTIAMARGESIPQTRMYLMHKIIRAGDPSQPLSDGQNTQPNPGIAYVPRYHDPPPTASGPVSSSATVPNHATAKKDARRREEARSIHLGRGVDEANDRHKGWQEVYGIAWEDLQDFEKLGRVLYPGRQDSSSPSDQEGWLISNHRVSDRRQDTSRESPKPKEERKSDGS